MIIIKIKTWKDWKRDFLNWVQAPRRQTCKEFVDYMASLQQEAIYNVINSTCDKYSNMSHEQVKNITEALEKCVDDCKKQTHELIDDCQSIKFL